MENPSAKELGEFLRQKRIEMNYSLKDVENATSIRMTYLQAIEEGDVQKLISSVYAQGFFRQYASFLGLDGEKIVRENPKVFHQRFGAPQDFAYGIGTLEVRGNPDNNVKWFPNAIWILAFTGVVILAWYFARYMGVI